MNEAGTTHERVNDPLLTIAVSSRALFDFEDENKIFDEEDETAYMRAQLALLDTPAKKGIAFPMVKKLLAFNRPEQQLVDVVVMSRNDPTTGLRVFRSISEYQLDIRRGCFTRGSASLPYLTAFKAHLFLSAFEEDVRAALDNGFAAARVLGSVQEDDSDDDTLRIAFDGDAVLFGDEAEQVYQEHGLKAFQEQEKELATHPLPEGPVVPFLKALQQLRAALPQSKKIRTALITSRGAPAHERPIRTLKEWGLEVDEAYFLSGKNKESVLDSFRPDFFFDDQQRHLNKKQPGGHVTAGILNDHPTTAGETA